MVLVVEFGRGGRGGFDDECPKRALYINCRHVRNTLNLRSSLLTRTGFIGVFTNYYKK